MSLLSALKRLRHNDEEPKTSLNSVEEITYSKDRATNQTSKQYTMLRAWIKEEAVFPENHAGHIAYLTVNKLNEASLSHWSQNKSIIV